MLEKSKESRRHWTKAQKEAILREYDHGSDSSLAVFAGFLQLRKPDLYRFCLKIHAFSTLF